MMRLPTEYDLTLALVDLFRSAGLHWGEGAVTVSSVSNITKRIYRLVPSVGVANPLSEVLSSLLHRDFADEECPWVIDVREARTLVKAFGR